MNLLKDLVITIIPGLFMLIWRFIIGNNTEGGVIFLFSTCFRVGIEVIVKEIVAVDDNVNVIIAFFFHVYFDSTLVWYKLFCILS